MPALRVVVTGGHGFIARATIATLRDRGHHVRSTVRTPAQTPVTDEMPVGDLGPETDWTRALEDADAVVHLAARVHVQDERASDPLAAFRHVNVAGTAALVDAAHRVGVRTFIFVSTIGVVAETSERAVDESTPCSPATPYAVSKLEAERLVLAASGGVRVAVFRPPMVYGAHAPGNFGRLLEAVRRGWVLPFASVRNRRSLLFVGNLAHALATAVEHPGAKGIYHVADAEAVSTPDLVTMVASALGRPARLIAVPMPLLRLAAASVGRSAMLQKLTSSLPVDTGRIQRELGCVPPWSLQAAIARSVTSS